MPKLSYMLHDHDLGFLKMVATHWGVELTAPDAASALPILLKAMLDETLTQEIFETLPEEGKTALSTISQNNGLMLWAQFSRRFGDVRTMGSARRDRERPDLNPATTSEILWYRGMIGRAFLNISGEPQEYVYIPDEFFERLASFAKSTQTPPGKPANPAALGKIVPANDQILDDACTLLAGLRSGIPEEMIEKQIKTLPFATLQQLLQDAAIIETTNIPAPEKTRLFLEAPRSEALLMLSSSYIQSTRFNELLQLDQLVFEGNLENQPRRTRQIVFDFLHQIPENTWWNLDAFIRAIHEKNPDFQRPAGDYDSWFIRRKTDGQYLRGFDTWNEVDGALIRYLITGPMHWLGFTDIAYGKKNNRIVAFRRSTWESDLIRQVAPKNLPLENEKIKPQSDGRISVPNLAPRSLRYQIARFCDWQGASNDEYRYQISPDSLARSHQQGLKISLFSALLKRHLGDSFPPALGLMLERWDSSGTQAHLVSTTLLRVENPEMIEALKNTRAARYMDEQISPTVMIIKPGGEKIIRQTLAEIGYLTDDNLS